MRWNYLGLMFNGKGESEYLYCRPDGALIVLLCRDFLQYYRPYRTKAAELRKYGSKRQADHFLKCRRHDSMVGTI